MVILGEPVPLWLLTLPALPFLALFALRQFYIGLLILDLRRRTDGAHQWYVMVTQYQQLREQFRLRHWTRKRNGETFYQWTLKRESNPLRRLWVWLVGQPPRLELETDDEYLMSFAVADWELPVPPVTVRELMNARGYTFDGSGELVPLAEATPLPPAVMRMAEDASAQPIKG